MVVLTTPRPGVDATRFAAAARHAARFRHPPIASILAVEEHGGVPLMVSAFVRGHTLTVLSRSSPDVALVQVLHQAADLSDALAFAHDHGLLHRPFSPDDVIVDAQGDVCLVGGGVVTAAAGGPGTPTLSAAIGAIVYDLLGGASARAGHRGEAHVPLIVLRPDLDAGATAFIDAWVIGRHRVPLTALAADLRDLASGASQFPRLVSVDAAPADGLRTTGGPTAPVPTAFGHADDVAGGGLEAFNGEVPAVVPARPALVRPPFAQESTPPSGHRLLRPSLLAAAAATGALIVLALWWSG